MISLEPSSPILVFSTREKFLLYIITVHLLHFPGSLLALLPAFIDSLLWGTHYPLSGDLLLPPLLSSCYAYAFPQTVCVWGIFSRLLAQPLISQLEEKNPMFRAHQGRAPLSPIPSIIHLQ